MKTLKLFAAAGLGILLVSLVPTGPFAPAAAAAERPVKFGMDMSALQPLTDAGIKPDYGLFWIGPWTLTSGWGGPDALLDRAYAAGVTPVIQFYYWGDDISPSCVENGCYSTLHRATKNKAGWDLLAQQLGDHLNARLKGKPALVIVESEFNKGGIQSYEPFDGYLAEKARQLRADYPAVQVVLGFGNWGTNSWSNFDRAAAASDLVGLQAMRGSTKDTLTHYYDVVDSTLASAKFARGLFGKPLLLTDLALSSYPEPTYLGHQATMVGTFFDRLDDLQAAGVTGVVYRSLRDSPGMDLANYYGLAERSWGLVWANGTAKPAHAVWVAGIKAERLGLSEPTAAFAATTAGLTVAVDASATRDADGDVLTYTWSFGDGSVASGLRAAHTYARAGAYTVRLSVGDGVHSDTAERVVEPNRAPVARFTFAAAQAEVAFNGSLSYDLDRHALTHSWAFGDGTTGTGRLVEKAYAVSGTYAVTLSVSDGKAVHRQVKNVTVKVPLSATFTPTQTTNNHWVEFKVAANAPLAKVEAKVGSGAWSPLPKTSWGTYAESRFVPDGAQVRLRATSHLGQVLVSAPVTWR